MSFCHKNLTHLRTETIIASEDGNSEELQYFVCKVCGTLWMARFQYHPGTGSDNFWIREGQSDRGRGYEFPAEKARELRGMSQ
jgi:hypothetical protein